MQKELFKGTRMPCFEIPELAQSVLIVPSDDGGWFIEFETPAGWMVLARKTDYRMGLEFKSLDSVVKRLRDLGWGQSILIAEWRA